MISCLTVTYNRPEFYKFLLWNFNKQTCIDKELVVIDGSESGSNDVFNQDNIKYIHVPGLKSIPEKRNMAIANASGKIITWFDDDDYQAPDRLEKTEKIFSEGFEFCGSRFGFFYSIENDDCILLDKIDIIFNSMAVLRKHVSPTAFDERKKIASDCGFMHSVYRKVPRSKIKCINDILFFWLTHGSNISNPTWKRINQKRFKGGMLNIVIGKEREQFYNLISGIKLCQK